jgi:hypothetical protein
MDHSPVKSVRSEVNYFAYFRARCAIAGVEAQPRLGLNGTRRLIVNPEPHGRSRLRVIRQRLKKYDLLKKPRREAEAEIAAKQGVDAYTNGIRNRPAIVFDACHANTLPSLPEYSLPAERGKATP